MLRRMFLLLVMVMHFVLPAFADPEPIENNTEIPEIQEVQEPQQTQVIPENQTSEAVTNIDILPDVASIGCNQDDLFGRLSGSIEFEANWTPRTFKCNAGEYLSGSAGKCLDCPVGSYCEGMTEEIVFDDKDHGSEPCPEGYTSNVGNSEISECYKIEIADINYCESMNSFSGRGMPRYRKLNHICTHFFGTTDSCVAEIAKACEIERLICEPGYTQAEVNGELDCVQDVYHCEAGTYLPAGAKKCAVCPEDHYCPERDYVFNEQQDQGKNVCPEELHSPVASRAESDCGRILHIGDQRLYLHSDEAHRTHPAFVVLVDGKKYYADITPVAQGVKTISPETTESLHMKIGGQEYTVHSRTYTVNGDVEMVVESVSTTNSVPEMATEDDSDTGDVEPSITTDNNAENSGNDSLDTENESPDSANSESQD